MSDTEKNRSIVRNTGILYIRMLFTMGVSLYTSRVVLDTLGVVDFGIYNVVGGIITMFSFLNGTLGAGTMRFITFQLGKNDFDELKKVFSISVTIHFLLAIVILILAETVGLWFLSNKLNVPVDRMQTVQWVYQFSVFTSLLTIIQIPYSSSLIAHENMTIYAYVGILEVVLRLILVYLLIISSYDKLLIYSLLIFLVNVIVMCIYRFYCLSKYRECKYYFVWDKEIYKSMLSFSGWNIFGCMADTGSNQGVNILLNLFFGPSVNAARGISYQVSSALNVFVTNFQTAASPQIVKKYAENKIDELHSLLFQNAKYAFLLLFFISLPVMFELDIILYWWLKNVPEMTALFCRLIILQTLFYSMIRPFIIAIHGVGKMKYVNLTGGMLLLMVMPVSYVFLKMGFPVYIPFIVYIFGTLGEFVFVLYFLTKYINLSFKDLILETVIPILKVVLISLLLPFLAYLLLDKGFIRFVVILFSCWFSILICTYFLAMDENIRLQVKNFIRSKLG